jgi:hypothetical protein
MIGIRKIAVEMRNQNGNEPAKALWDRMSSGSDQSRQNCPFTVSASIVKKDGLFIWYYKVK